MTAKHLSRPKDQSDVPTAIANLILSYVWLNWHFTLINGHGLVSRLGELNHGPGSRFGSLARREPRANLKDEVIVFCERLKFIVAH